MTWGPSGAALDALRAYAVEVHFPARATVFDEGDPADSMYLVLRGMVLVQRRDPDGTVRTLTSVTEGQSFGEMGLLLQRPRLAMVTAGLDSTLLKITGSAIARLETERPDLALELYKTLARTLAEQWFQRGMELL